VRVARQLADDEPPRRLQHPRDLGQRRVLVGDLAEDRGQHDRIDGVVLVRQGGRVSPRGHDVLEPALGRAAHGVVQELLLKVEDLDGAAGPEPGRHVERVVAGPGADLQHSLARLGAQHGPQALTGDQGVRGVDPEPLGVRAGRRVLAPPVRRGEDGEREQEQGAAH
jgi:hypothetical protein